MSHLTDEQLEGLLQGQPLDSDHLQSCPDCQARLKEKQILAFRLKTAFSQVNPSPELLHRIRSQMAAKTTDQSSSHHPSVLRLPPHWKRWAVTFSGIAAVLILIPLLKIAFVPEPAYADLVEIHQHNLSEDQDYMSENDPNVLARHFQEKLGFNPRLPKLGQGLALRGCCIKHFQGHIVGSYVVDSPQAIISIVVVQDDPARLGLKPLSRIKGKTYYQSQFARCDMVAVRLDNYTYCAVGEAPQAYLQTLLQQLIP